MIFCDEPWCNEPGRENDAGSYFSSNYNRSLYPSVVKYGMIEWLEGKRSQVDPRSTLRGRMLGSRNEDVAERRHNRQGVDIWEDVVKKHFEANEEEIIQAVCLWVNDEPNDRQYEQPAAKNAKKYSTLIAPDGADAHLEAKTPKAVFHVPQMVYSLPISARQRTNGKAKRGGY